MNFFRMLAVLIFSLLFFLYIGCASLNSNPPSPERVEAQAVTSENSEDVPSSYVDKQLPVANNETLALEEEKSEIQTALHEEQIEKKGLNNEKNIEPLTDQELIDSALEYCQASNEFWEQGDLENAIGCLDKALSFTLKINNSTNPEILQEKDDLRITIAKRMVEVYSSRFTVANGTHKEIPLDMNGYVQKEIDSFKGREKKWFLKVYARSGKYRPAILRELRKAGLPEELSWLPLIESGYSTKALSNKSAMGMWQFIASTGYKYGLKRNTWIDERMDPEKSTKAAIAYLTELHQIFGEWKTALAGYNCGEARVIRAIKSQKISYMDDFWDLFQKLPNETARYVPRFYAVLHILKDPETYGFELPPLEKELGYEKITVKKMMSLNTLAKTMDIKYDQLKELNPSLFQNVTPKTTYELKVPKGKGAVLTAKLDDIPVYNPPTPAYVTHRVRSGESLSVIADRYKTSIKSIMNMNNLKKKDYLRVGWKLKIPTGKYTPVTYADSSGTPTKYIVQKGDSLWKIAKRFGTTVNSIKAVNGLSSSTLQIGQVLTVSKGSTDSKPGVSQSYIVRSGDSPYLIAKRHSMNLYDFLKINNLTAKSTIYPGQEVKIIPR
ncbi:LysM peptidoglycan-binding domain-containing protein [Thermodesulfobacteriota bacterium]